MVEMVQFFNRKNCLVLFYQHGVENNGKLSFPSSIQVEIEYLFGCKFRCSIKLQLFGQRKKVSSPLVTIEFIYLVLIFFFLKPNDVDLDLCLMGLGIGSLKIGPLRSNLAISRYRCCIILHLIFTMVSQEQGWKKSHRLKLNASFYCFFEFRFSILSQDAAVLIAMLLGQSPYIILDIILLIMNFTI